jgi:hypothetical protein
MQDWHRSFIRRLAVVVACLLLSWVIMGCEKGAVSKDAAAHFEIEKHYQHGPVQFTLKASRKQISIADRLQLELTAVVDEDYEASLPEFGDKLEQFGIVDYQAPAPRLLEGGRVQIRKTYELEPFLSGDYTIPAMKVHFWKNGEEEQKHELESEPITIRVASLLKADGAKLVIREISPPVELPGPPPALLYALAGAIVLGGGCLGFFFWRRRRKRQQDIVTARPAHAIAFDELERLLAEELVEKGEVKLFYLRLSHILRHYIENRFGLRAPERTTEEFLADLRHTKTLVAEYKNLLQEFLRHCDLVKFANHWPGNAEIEQAFDAAKRFILETRGPESEDAAVTDKVAATGVSHAV